MLASSRHSPRRGAVAGVLCFSAPHHAGSDHRIRRIGASRIAPQVSLPILHGTRDSFDPFVRVVELSGMGRAALEASALPPRRSASRSASLSMNWPRACCSGVRPASFRRRLAWTSGIRPRSSSGEVDAAAAVAKQGGFSGQVSDGHGDHTASVLAVPLLSATARTLPYRARQDHRGPDQPSGRPAEFPATGPGAAVRGHRRQAMARDAPARRTAIRGGTDGHARISSSCPRPGASGSARSATCR